MKHEFDFHPVTLKGTLGGIMPLIIGALLQGNLLNK